MMRPTIEPIACLRDNYCYLISSAQTGDAWLVDPSDVGPPAEAVVRTGLKLRGILATHHHWDHVNGIEGLLERFGADGSIWVAGHASDRGRIPGQTAFVDAPLHFVPTSIELAGLRLQAAHIPGHTLGAIAWCLPADEAHPADVFTGDTLFAAGCGRLFEGTPAQMLASLQTICSLPEPTRLWFGHEYTEANLRFAATVEPDNDAIAARQRDLPGCTTPTTVAQEKATNPFVRAPTVEALAQRRKAKDSF
jgi:hydroxyacylglutathione hydrolase